MSQTAELEQLAKKRTKLEDDWASVVKKENTLKDDVKGLEERLQAQLTGKIEAKNASVEKLESTKHDLEAKLKELQESPESSQTPNMPETETTVEQQEEPQEQPTEMIVEATTNDSQEIVEEPTRGRSREDKRRRWL